MNLNIIRPKNDTEDLLLSITKNYETLIKLEFKLTRPRQSFHFSPPIQIDGSLMVGLISLEVYYFFLI